MWEHLVLGLEWVRSQELELGDLGLVLEHSLELLMGIQEQVLELDNLVQERTLVLVRVLEQEHSRVQAHSLELEHNLELVHSQVLLELVQVHNREQELERIRALARILEQEHTQVLAHSQALERNLA